MTAEPFQFDGQEIEAGRLLFAGQCDFIAAAQNLPALPPISLPEIAFAGRSNVGKSSLVNALTGRTTLARTSQTPGRTRQLVFFSLANRLQLVDLPGYGYAKAAKTDIKAWTKLTRKFLVGRQSLQRMLLLIDSRRGIGPADKEMMKLMDESAVSWAVVLTKTDKLKPTQAQQIYDKTQQEISRHVAAFPHVWTTSSQTGAGIAELRAHLASLSLPPSDRSG
ncbi:ribosome biogenesis GTP-binding protein YsxC/EngB [SAR116 cluster alpha proteobacterium HIMB100]|nr:ribosome biogenesis GTP-binding protein YsxC/EngB [SAR116 cluster alpha proteobacterium HIMB100]